MTNTVHYRDARKWFRVDLASTTVLRETGAKAWLHQISINSNPNSSTITVYNNGAASGDIVYQSTIGTGNAFKKSIGFDIPLNNGLTLVLSADIDVTIIYE